MNCTRIPVLLLLAWIPIGSPFARGTSTPAAPLITNFHSSNAVEGFSFTLYPAAQAYTILSTTNLKTAFVVDTNFLLTPRYSTNYSTNVVNNTNVLSTNVQTSWEWRRTNATSSSGWHRVAATPLSNNALLAATVLNRLTYGPTPDELDRIRSIGPDAYIAEQLAPWTITEDVASTHTNIPLIEARLVSPTNYCYRTNATLSDLRAWHILRAVGARRQLLEILVQFLENHFVTQHAKTDTWFAKYFDDGTHENVLAAQAEFHEVDRWRNALLNPQCTFHDLLKISAESVAMIIYLDTVDSRVDGGRVANENYARELMELFTLGVDNGYDQSDIAVLSRAWTGWNVEIVDFANAFNPFASRTTVILPGSTNPDTTVRSNLFGTWRLNYKSTYHSTTNKTIFPGKIVPARFGAPWTTQTYGTNTTPGLYQLFVPGRSGTNGMAEGYEILQHLANLPFTEEYLSIKLCRLFVHDDFPNPSVDPAAPEYAFYNYGGGGLTPEAELVKACLLAWETNSPKGQVWKVLDTIFKSDLFRGHGASQQKVKTPLEYTVSAIRALRSSTNGSYTAATDGYAIPTPLNRMGTMLLFDRDAPDGYPEAGPPWISAGTLAERVRWVQSFCIAGGQSGHTGSQSGTGNDAQNSVCDIVTLLKAKLPAASWTNAAEVVDYFLDIFYPGEGAGNLAFARHTAIGFLNDGSADTSSSDRTKPFSELPVSNSPTQPYDERVRGMVGSLLSLPRFQEQ